MVEEYCRVITQMTECSCRSQIDSSVLGFEFNLDCLRHRYIPYLLECKMGFFPINLVLKDGRSY
jgi:hypothetical protein